MKRGARLAVLLTALLVLVGAWYLAATLSDRQQAQQAMAAEQGHEDISVGTAEEVTAIAWDYFGDAVSLTKTDGTWENAEDDACPIDSTAVEALVETVSSLEAVDRIDEVTDFAQYGLEDCAYEVIAQAGDRVIKYEIGSQSPNGGQYVRLNGEDAVVVETGLLGPAFEKSLDDVLKMETLPQDIDLVTGLAVESDGGLYELQYLTEAQDVWYTDADPWFLMDGQSKPLHPLDTEKVEALYGLATDLIFTACEDWNMADPAKYGLDEPQGTVLVGYVSDQGQKESFVLLFGDYDNGDVYVCLEGSKMVYRVSGTVLDGLMYPDFDDMATLDPCALDWDRLQSVTLDIADGESYEIVRTQVEGEDGEPADAYTQGDRSLDADAVADWLQQLTEMPADSRADPAGEREELFRLTFRQDSDAFPEVTALFRAYDSAHYLCAVNGQEQYLVARTTAENVKNKALEFLIPLPED